MSAPRSYDAIVIGGGTGGLVAAAYLGKARKNVLLLEAQDKFGGRCALANLGEGFTAAQGASTLQALDPLMVRQLKLSRHGLRFASRDLPLVGLRKDGRHIVIQRDVHHTVASIAIHSQSDARAWPIFRKELFELALAMRPFWWDADGAWPTGREKQKIERIARMGAAAWLDSWFESEAFKATLCADAIAGGISILEPGSALSLVWRAAQEMSGLQGAVAIPQGSVAALTTALVVTCQEHGCELRTGARVVRVFLDGNSVAGVQTETGETCFAPLICSAVKSRPTISKFLPHGALGIAHESKTMRGCAPLTEARLLLTLRRSPALGGPAMPASRFVIAERTETYVTAELAARDGKIGDELPIEFVVPTLVDPALAPAGQHIVSAVAGPIPMHPTEGWSTMKQQLAAKAVAAIEKLSPGFSREISNVEIFPPRGENAEPPITAPHMLTSARERIETPIAGLYLCGENAEPVRSVSGRAARIAVSLAKEARR